MTPSPAWPDPLPPVRPDHYRIVWVADLPRDEFADAAEAAAHARELAADPAALVNVYHVIDGNTGAVTEHDFGA